MKLFHNLGALPVSLLFLASASAQTIGLPGAVVTSGTTITITVTGGPSGGSGKITVTHGFPPVDDAIPISFDGNGEGKVQWVVPNWSGAHFNFPGATEQSCLIEPPA